MSFGDGLTDLEVKVRDATNDADIPPYAKVLMECFISIVKEIKSLNEAVTSRIELLESDLVIQQTITTNLESEIIKLKSSLDNFEQRNRNINLVLHGVPEQSSENLKDECAKIISENIINLSSDEIARCHRLGPVQSRSSRSSGLKPRAVIIRFRDEEKKLNVYKNKRNLKGKPFLLTENLTKSRYELFKKASRKYGIRNVWTSEGHILTKINGNLHEIKCEDDI